MAADPFLRIVGERRGTKRPRPAKTSTRMMTSTTSTTSKTAKLARTARPPAKTARQATKRGKREDAAKSDESDESDEIDAHADEDKTDAETDEETDAERRLRLAKAYLGGIRSEAADGFDARDLDRDIIAERLKEDAAADRGHVQVFVGAELDADTLPAARFVKSRARESVTCVDVRVDRGCCFVGSKDGCLGMYALRTGRRLRAVASAHKGPILCLALSKDAQYLVTGGTNGKMIVWNPENLALIKSFSHHRGAVTGLAVDLKTNGLVSASTDRTLKVWSLGELMYIETLFGHQDQVVDVSAIPATADRCVSVGARDRTARLWKIADESQLVFKRSSAEGSIDCVAAIDRTHFVTGSDNGTIALWSTQKRKPLYSRASAHAAQPPPSPSQHSAESDPPTQPPFPAQPRWITALSAIPLTDLFFSGSWDGTVKVWRLSPALDSFEPLLNLDLPCPGVVNSIKAWQNRKKDIQLVAAVGHDSRLGRWISLPDAKNGLACFRINRRRH